MVPTDQGLAVRSGSGWTVVDRTRGFAQRHDSAALEDREGSLWIGLIGAGIARWLGRGEWEAWTSGAGPAVGCDLEHPAGPERSPLGGDFPRLGAPGRAGAANHLDQEGRPRAATTSDGWARPPTAPSGPSPDRAVWRASNRQPEKSISLAGRIWHCSRLEPCLRRPSGPRLAGDRLRSLPQQPAGRFRSLHPHRSTRVARARGLGGDHGSGEGAMWITNPDGLWRYARRLLAPLREIRRPPQRRRLHSGSSRRMAHCGCAIGWTPESNGYSFPAIASCARTRSCRATPSRMM